MTIYLAGHGNWDVRNTDAPWAKVPPGTTIHFYTENGRTLATASMAMIAIERGESVDFVPSGRDILSEPAGEYSEYRSAPNYTLYPDTPDKCRLLEWVIGTGNVIFVDQETPLCTGTGADGTACMDSPRHTCEGLFADPRVEGQEVVWLACTAYGLDPAGGQALGVNTSQPVGSDDWEAFTNDAWQRFCNMGPDDYWAYFLALDPQQQVAVLSWDDVRNRFVQEGRFRP